MNALVLIDIQNDYFPGGRMELPESGAAGEKAARLLAAARERGMPVFHVQHISTHQGADFFLPGTPGAEINSCVRPLSGEAVIQKNYPNSFRETGLFQQLRGRGITNIVVAGMMTQMCVDTTVRAAFDLGFACLLAHDACAARGLSFLGESVSVEKVQAAYMAALSEVFAQVEGAADIIARLK